MKTSSKINVGVAAVAALALALPAGAFAHPSVWETTAKITNSASSPVPDLCSGTDTRKSYAITNHGFTMVLNETNCAVDKGMLNYKKLPSSYRATLSLAAYLAAGDTGAQPHATCRQGSGVVDELWGTTAGTSAITAWQTAKTNTAGGEPFFNYVPWQKTSAGLEDDPTTWIPVVLAKTGVDLSSYSTVDEFTAACAGIGGVYTAADKIGTTMQSMNSGFAHDITATVTAAVTAEVTAEVTAAVTAAVGAPLNSEVAKLTTEVANLSRVLTVKAASANLAAKTAAGSGVAVKISGPAGYHLRAFLVISEAGARHAGLRYRGLGTADVTIGDAGTADATIKLNAAAQAKLKALGKDLPVRIEVKGADRFAAGELTLTK